MTLPNMGVPLPTGEPAGLVKPIAPYRFRVNAGNFTTITRDTVKVEFDFATKTVTLVTRQSVLPGSFEEALAFANFLWFSVDALDGGDAILFTISPEALRLQSHNFTFDYAATGHAACHTFVYTFDSINTSGAIARAEHDGDPRFPPIAELDLSVAPEVLELDEQQESRFTPDNPDTDGDGTPDKQDEFPYDPTRK